MNWIDVCLLGIITLSASNSLGQSFVAEVLSLTAWLIAFILALSVMNAVATLLQDFLLAPDSRNLFAFMSAFVLTLSLLLGLNSLIMQALNEQAQTWPYRILAIAFGSLRGGLIAMLLVFITQGSLLATTQLWHTAYLIPPLQYGNQLLVKQLVSPDAYQHINCTKAFKGLPSCGG